MELRRVDRLCRELEELLEHEDPGDPRSGPAERWVATVGERVLELLYLPWHETATAFVDGRYVSIDVPATLEAAARRFLGVSEHEVHELN